MLNPGGCGWAMWPCLVKIKIRNFLLYFFWWPYLLFFTAVASVEPLSILEIMDGLA
jgi:hypothetical protein